MQTKRKVLRIARDNFCGVTVPWLKRAGVTVSHKAHFELMGKVADEVIERMQGPLCVLIESGNTECLNEFADVVEDVAPLNKSLTKMLLIEIVQKKLMFFFEDVDKKQYKDIIEQLRYVLAAVVVEAAKKIQNE